MSKQLLIAAALAIASSATLAAGNCDAIRAQIDSKIRASGVTAFTLTTVDAGASVNGRVVGTCDRGARKIVYDASAAAGAAPAPREEPMLTECRDGSVSVGGSCKK